MKKSERIIAIIEFLEDCGYTKADILDYILVTYLPSDEAVEALEAAVTEFDLDLPENLD